MMKGAGYFPEEIFSRKMKRKKPKQLEDNSSEEKNEEYSPEKEVPSDLKEAVEHDTSTGDDGEDAEEEEEEQWEPSKQLVSHGFDLVKGKMDHGMEDYIVAETKKMNGHERRLYAIFDGHSGCDVAEYLQSHLFDNILSEPDFWTSPKRAIKRAYKATDYEILDKVVGKRGGSTAVTAILIDREKLIVVNVGNSRAILCRNGAAEPITVDHEPQKEKHLVESRGGFILERPGNVPRVDGQLAMTRAFGDGKLKDHITSEPDVVVKTIDMYIDFIILASDGLWKVMSSQDAADCIKNFDDAQEASEKLIEKALSRRSLDDISCIVVMFQ